MNTESALPASLKLQVLQQRHRPSDLAEDGAAARSWVWDGYLGRGMVTLLTSQWKSGKTTLISILLARMGQGGQLAGLPVTAGRAAVISEERKADWDTRCKKLKIGDHVSFFCRPFQAKPNMAQWQGLLDAMLELRQSEGLALLVIDSLSVFLPGQNENSAGAVTNSLLPLEALTAQGVSVLLVHHPRKGANVAGQAARGSGALASYVDILIEKSWYGKPEDVDRRRWLRAFSRHEDTRRHLVVELTGAGDDYLLHDPTTDEASAECWTALELVLQDANERLTQQTILEEWPQDYAKPSASTLGRVLRRAVLQEQILQAGSGRRNDPFRYWLAANEMGFQPGPGASPEQRERFQIYWRKKVCESLGVAYEEDKPADSAPEPKDAMPVRTEEEARAEIEDTTPATAQGTVEVPLEETVMPMVAEEAEPSKVPEPTAAVATPPETAAPEETAISSVEPAVAPALSHPPEVPAVLKEQSSEKQREFRRSRRLPIG